MRRLSAKTKATPPSSYRRSAGAVSSSDASVGERERCLEGRVARGPGRDRGDARVVRRSERGEAQVARRDGRGSFRTERVERVEPRLRGSGRDNTSISVFAWAKSSEETVAHVREIGENHSSVRSCELHCASGSFRGSQGLGEARFDPHRVALSFVQGRGAPKGNAGIVEGFGVEPIAGRTTSAIACQK